MSFDVTTLHGRRADERWNRMAVGDILERVTWVTPDREAIVGWEGAFGDPRFARVTSSTAAITRRCSPRSSPAPPRSSAASPTPGRDPDADDIIAFCRERLAGYEAPKQIIVVDEMPETVGGKILKYRLRQRFAAAAPAPR